MSIFTRLSLFFFKSTKFTTQRTSWPTLQTSRFFGNDKSIRIEGSKTYPRYKTKFLEQFRKGAINTLAALLVGGFFYLIGYSYYTRGNVDFEFHFHNDCGFLATWLNPRKNKEYLKWHLIFKHIEFVEAEISLPKQQFVNNDEAYANAVDMLWKHDWKYEKYIADEKKQGKKIPDHENMFYRSFRVKSGKERQIYERTLRNHNLPVRGSEGINKITDKIKNPITLKMTEIKILEEKIEEFLGQSNTKLCEEDKKWLKRSQTRLETLKKEVKFERKNPKCFYSNIGMKDLGEERFIIDVSRIDSILPTKRFHRDDINVMGDDDDWMEGSFWYLKAFPIYRLRLKIGFWPMFFLLLCNDYYQFHKYMSNSQKESHRFIMKN